MIKSAQKATRGEGGFTLIELLVVMIIIAILMAVAVPTFLKQKQNAVRSQATSNVKQIVNAVEACAVDNVSGSYSAPTPCDTTAAITTSEPALNQITSSGSKFTVAPASNGYTVTVTTATGAAFTESHTNSTVAKTCKAGSEGAGTACPKSGTW